MKVFFVKSNRNIYYKRLDDIKLNNNIHDRFLVYYHLKKNLKSKIENFYLFYDNKNILICFITFRDFYKEEFLRVNINNEFLKNQIKQYFLYKKAKIAIETFHEKQLYGEFLPYTFHLNKVDGVIDHYFYSMPKGKMFVLKTSALLHDILEDTSFTSRDLKRDFGKEIFSIVNALTKRNIENFKIFEWIYFRKVAKNPLAIYVKIADKIINGKQTLKDKKLKNIRNMLINYKKFRNTIYDKFNNVDMKNHLDLIVHKIEKLDQNYS